MPAGVLERGDPAVGAAIKHDVFAANRSSGERRLNFVAPSRRIPGVQGEGLAARHGVAPDHARLSPRQPGFWTLGAGSASADDREARPGLKRLWSARPPRVTPSYCRSVGPPLSEGRPRKAQQQNPPGGIRRSELEVHAAGDRIRGERGTRVALQRDVVEARGSIIGVHVLAENFPIRPEMVGETATDRPAAVVKSRLFSNRKRIGVQAADRAEFLVMGDGRVGPSPAALDVRQEVSPGVAGNAYDIAAKTARIGRPFVPTPSAPMRAQNGLILYTLIRPSAVPIRRQCGQETPSHFCHSSARTGYVSGAPALRIPSIMRSRWAT